MNDKKGFLLYFDSWPMVRDLPAEQRGLLLTALYEYAQQVSTGEEGSMEEVLEGCPDMTSQTCMACRFIGTYILRDTQRWLSQQRSRTRRRQEDIRRPAPRAAAAGGGEDRAREDMERMRRLLDRIKGEA